VSCANARIGTNSATAMMRRRIDDPLRSGGRTSGLLTRTAQHLLKGATRGGPDVRENPGCLPVVHWAREAWQQHFEGGAARVPVKTFEQLRGLGFGDRRVERRQQH